MGDAPRVAIVTGAASGMGRATAVRLASSGLPVAALDRDPEGLETTLALIREQGVRCLALPLDVSDRMAVEDAIERAARDLGPPWLLAAVAAIGDGGFALDVEESRFRRVIDVNLFGVVWANVAAARMMVAEGHGGRIVNWSSQSAIGGGAGYSAYCASKAAVCSFTQSLAVELAPAGITVNAILPGLVRTPMVEHLGAEREAAELAAVPLGRWGEPEDVAALAAFLASDAAAWITGVTWNADGGAIAARGSGRIADVRASLELQAARPRKPSDRTA